MRVDSPEHYLPTNQKADGTSMGHLVSRWTDELQELHKEGTVSQVQTFSAVYVSVRPHTTRARFGRRNRICGLPLQHFFRLLFLSLLRVL